MIKGNKNQEISNNDVSNISVKNIRWKRIHQFHKSPSAVKHLPLLLSYGKLKSILLSDAFCWDRWRAWNPEIPAFSCPALLSWAAHCGRSSSSNCPAARQLRARGISSAPGAAGAPLPVPLPSPFSAPLPAPLPVPLPAPLPVPFPPPLPAPFPYPFPAPLPSPFPLRSQLRSQPRSHPRSNPRSHLRSHPAPSPAPVPAPVPRWPRRRDRAPAESPAAARLHGRALWFHANRAAEAFVFLLKRQFSGDR